MGRLSYKFLEGQGLAPNDVFIQTGTQAGHGLKYCAPHFKTIHTIELDRRYYEMSKERLAKFPHIHCHRGSSPVVLRKVIDPTRPTTIFLDAHFVATDDLPNQVKNQCPVLWELCAVFSFRWKARMAIVVDDAHMHQPSFWKLGRSRGYDKAQWPRAETLRATAAEFGYAMRHVDDVFVIERPPQ